jgi:toxin ParE1/3/4
MYELKINPIALNDLIGIKEYISVELDNPIAALRTIKNIISSYKKLEKFPLMGVNLSTIVDIPTDFRFITSGSYNIFYKVSNRYVQIYRILYAKSDFMGVLFLDQDNE